MGKLLVGWMVVSIHGVIGSMRLSARWLSLAPGHLCPNELALSERIALYGLFDVAGLVREYCNSPFARDTDTRVVRGGSYLTAK